MDKPTFFQRLSACILTCTWFGLVYNFTNWVTAQRATVPSAAFAWELHIPFIPLMVIPYWSIDLFFIAAPFVVSSCQELKILRQRIFWGIGIAGICFLLFPLKLIFVRPAVSGSLGVLFDALDNFNNFYNLAPSLHITLRTILWSVYSNHTKGAIRQLLGLWFFLIGASTILVWQHQIIDVFLGYLLGGLVTTCIQATHSEEIPISAKAQQNADYVIGARYLGVSLLFVALAYFFGLPGVFFIWPAASFVTVALAYLRLGPIIFQCNNSSAQKFLLAPYRFLSKLWQKKYLSSIPLVSKIHPTVWFGRFHSHEETLLLKSDGVHSLLYLASEYPLALANEYAQCKILLVLDLTLPSLMQLKDATDFIECNRPEGVVLVQCALGLGRSALIAAAWLLKANIANSAEDAINKVKQICPKAVLNQREKALLSQFHLAFNHQL